MSNGENLLPDNFGSRLKKYRLDKGLTGNKLAEIIGISQGSLSEIENGKREPSGKVFYGLAKNTDIDIKWLITGEKTGEGPKRLSEDDGMNPLLTGEERTKSIVQLEDEPKGGRKFDIINEVEEWLGEEVRRNPKKEIWFEVEMQESFSSFKEWKRKRDQQESGEYTDVTRKVA
jgi:transcriptional regulator with XRE-family HTH domain